MRHITHKKTTAASGFTLVEVMISMGIFTVLITIGIAAVLNAIQQHRTSENTRTVMDSLNFVMEDMARNLRLGANVRCVPSGETFPVFATDTDTVTPQDCALSTDAHNEILFNDENSKHITYWISPPTAADPVSHVYKVKGESFASRQLVTPPEVSIDFAKSGFTVVGSEPLDGVQPTVIIRLSGTTTYKGVDSTFAIETAVTLRGLDS